MASSKISDVTFRQSRNYNNPTSSEGEYIVNVAQRLFHMIPGDDEYNPDMGLDIDAHSKKQHENGERDRVYENDIRDQFTRFTSIVPLGVVAIYMNKVLYIMMNIQFQGSTYRMEASSALDNIVSITRANQ